MATTITQETLPDGRVGVAYSQDLEATGGTAPYTFAVQSGSLPTGLSLAGATGVISGTPTAVGEFTFTIRATDDGAVTDDQEFTVEITQGQDITNSNVDVLAAAVPAPFGPLTRVTDVDALTKSPNALFPIAFTDSAGTPVTLTWFQLNHAEAVQRAIAQAEGINYTVQDLIDTVALIYAYTDGIDSSGGPYTQAQYTHIIGLLRGIPEISGFN